MIYGNQGRIFWKETYDKFKDLEVDHFLKGSARLGIKNMGTEISENEMNVFKLPSKKDLMKIRRIF